MKKNKRPSGIAFYLSFLLGGRGRAGLLRMFARMKYKSLSVDVPSRLRCAEKILIILPEEPFMALQQVETVVSMVSHFSRSEITLFCEQSVAAYFKKIKGITSILTYEKTERFLFSRDFRTYGKVLARERFDVLFFLEKAPKPALLSIVIQSSVPLRISYEGVGDFPFFNFRVRPSENRIFMGDQNLYLLEALNIPVQKNIRWSVSKQGMEELEQLLQEHTIDSDAELLLVDINYVNQLCGKEWASTLIQELESRFAETQLCLYSSDTSNQGFVNWLQTFSIPVLSDLSSSRIAALVRRSSVVISGRSLLFQLAHLLGVAAIGIFLPDEVATMYRPTGSSKAVECGRKPDEDVSQKVIESVGELIGK
ncbi:MAG: glycosyltransferase family 9 protein [Chitinispirillaceae bacterium]